MSDTHEAPANEASDDVMNHDSTDAAQAGTPGTVPASAPDAANADIASMGYEQARDELAQIVTTLEGGRAPLEESMRLWERGEALADHCTRGLAGAQSRIDAAVARRENGSEGA